jgi:hypothetical protein
MVFQRQLTGNVECKLLETQSEIRLRQRNKRQTDLLSETLRSVRSSRRRTRPRNPVILTFKMINCWIFLTFSYSGLRILSASQVGTIWEFKKIYVFHKIILNSLELCVDVNEGLISRETATYMICVCKRLHFISLSRLRHCLTPLWLV